MVFPYALFCFCCEEEKKPPTQYEKKLMKYVRGVGRIINTYVKNNKQDLKSLIMSSEEVRRIIRSDTEGEYPLEPDISEAKKEEIIRKALVRAWR